MRDPMTRRLTPFGTSVFTEFTALARQHGAINLSQGYPDFDGPDVIKQAAVEHILHGHNQYAPAHGMPALRHAIAANTQRFYGIEVDPSDEVTVFSGATEALFSSIMGLVEAGDEVILLDPSYDSYAPSVAMAGAKAVRVPLRFPDFALDPEALRAAFSARTKLLIVNSPMNPCGKVFTRAEQRLLADLCLEHETFIISDEVYEHLTFDGAKHHTMLDLDGMRERTVVISSTAKTFSMTGWKIGYAVSCPALSRAVRSSHQFVTYCAPPPLQEAMAVGLGLDDDFFDAFRASYARRRTLLVDGLTALGFAVTAPAGTYFLTTSIAPLGYDDDYAFCRMLPARFGVAAIPVSAFYEDRCAGRQEIRLAFCKSEATLRTALERLEQLTAGA